MRITEIEINNFRAFYGKHLLNLDNDGKNLMVFGENGSGKSSVYWALYTLLQSSTKEIEETDKYFDFNHEENLLELINSQIFANVKLLQICNSK